MRPMFGDLTAGLLQAGLLIGLLAVCHVPLGRLLFHTATGERDLAVERACYRVIGVDPRRQQSWRHYLLALLGFSLVGVLVLYGLLRLQRFLPLSLGRDGFDPTGAFNTAISFLTNTNWQWYSGDTAAGHRERREAQHLDRERALPVARTRARDTSRGHRKGENERERDGGG